MLVKLSKKAKGKLGFSVCSVRLQSVSRFILYIIYNKIYILLYIIYSYENAHTLNEFAFCLLPFAFSHMLMDVFSWLRGWTEWIILYKAVTRLIVASGDRKKAESQRTHSGLT